MESKDKDERSPSVYFAEVKEKKKNVTDKDLDKFYENSLTLFNRYETTGQVAGMKKLMFLIECIEKERELVKMGINTFVHYTDIAAYIDTISKNVVKIIELERYERDIPDEAIEMVKRTKHLFDQYYIVFTDYAGMLERQTKEERRAIRVERDPILFGCFRDKNENLMVERFYFLADWEDEYCHLTLAKMVEEMKRKGKNIEHQIEKCSTANLRERLEKVTSSREIKTAEKKGIFRNLKTFMNVHTKKAR